MSLDPGNAVAILRIRDPISIIVQEIGDVVVIINLLYGDGIWIGNLEL